MRDQVLHNDFIGFKLERFDHKRLDKLNLNFKKKLRRKKIIWKQKYLESHIVSKIFLKLLFLAKLSANFPIKILFAKGQGTNDLDVMSFMVEQYNDESNCLFVWNKMKAHLTTSDLSM